MGDKLKEIDIPHRAGNTATTTICGQHTKSLRI